ncbi:hypothetical protein ACVOMS_15225 [Bradyrhizobium guangxiense]
MKLAPSLGLEPLGIGLLANASEHAIAAPDQEFCSGPANAGGRTGDDDGSHSHFPFLCPAINVGERRAGATPQDSQAAHR